MDKKNIIMSWSKCKIEVARLIEDSDAMPASLKSIGIINDKSTSLATEDGDKLQAKASGGIVIAEEDGEPIVTLTTRVKEMDFDTESMFTGAEVSPDKDELTVKTNVVPGYFAMKLTPKNIGAIGIKARKCGVKFRTGSTEEEGSFVDLTFTIFACADGELYKKYRVKSEDWADANE